jgi:murein DD-endopeptidase MepM/ murein hydrolase activator NlpD
MTTPYDGKIGLVFWSGQSVGEHTIAELARTIREHAPNVAAVYVKTSDGATWQGEYDDKPAMAIYGPSDIARWVQILGDHDLEFHAWCVLKGEDAPAESEKVIEACRVPGVRSMLLDVEDGPGYFAGGPGDARYLIQRVRVRAPAGFHLGLNFDARGQHPKHIYIRQWLPYVGSLHPMVYHRAFGKSVAEALQDAFRASYGFGKPVYPMLQAYGGVTPQELRRAAEISFQDFGAGGVSYFRLGTIDAAGFAAISRVTVPGAPGDGGEVDEPSPPPDTVVVRPGGPGYSDGAFGRDPARAWETFVDRNGHLIKYKLIANPQQVYARYRPDLPRHGRYAIEVFIPDRYAEAQEALYIVVDYVDGERRERKIALDQSIHYNEWAQLGVFELDPANPDAGRVDLVDYSRERPLRRIAFSPIRWRPLSGDAPPLDEAVADGFDAPVGTAAERRERGLWPGHWQDANEFLNRYVDSAGNVAYHTGADLNLNYPRWNMDRGAPVYAAASGTVIWAGRVGDFWRNVIVIKHDPLPDGVQVHTRYAHVENMRVRAGDRMRRGQPIAAVGKSGGNSGNYHLHFDVSPTDALASHPGHWPGDDREAVQRHYVDPERFIRENRP